MENIISCIKDHDYYSTLHQDEALHSFLTQEPIELTIQNYSSDSRETKTKDKSKTQIETEEREKLRFLLSNFTEEQLNRYEMFRRSVFPKTEIKEIIQKITDNSVSQKVVISMSGIVKVFIGEVIEEALDIMESQGDTVPLHPKHLREAVRRLKKTGVISFSKKRNYNFYT